MTVTETKPHLASKFSWLRPSRNEPLSRYVGIDVGVDSVKVVDLGVRHHDMSRSSQRKQKTLRWLGCHRFSLPIDPLAAPPSNWVDRVIETLMDRLPRSVDGNQNVVAASLPLPWIHYQVVPESELDASRRQCDAMFASSLFKSKSHLAFWSPHVREHLDPDEPLMIAAVAESAANDIAEAISRLGYQIEAIVPQGIALVDAAGPMTGIDPECIAMLDHSGSLIAMCNQIGCGLCRTLPAIPDQVLAEARADGLTLDAIRSWLTEIAAEISATRRYARRGQEFPEVKPLLVCGDVAAIPGVDETLAALIAAPVARWSYAGQARPTLCQVRHATSNQSVPDLSKDAEYAVALSLAHTAVQSVSGRPSA